MAKPKPKSKPLTPAEALAEFNRQNPDGKCSRMRAREKKLSARTVLIEVRSGLVEVCEFPDSVRVVVHDYDHVELADDGDIDKAPEYSESIYEVERKKRK